ncbi:MAG: preprotein translocase subunit SecA [bacterium]
MSLLTKILGDPNEKVLKQIRPIINKINEIEPKFKKIDDKEFKKITARFQDLLKDKVQEELNKKTDEILPEAFAAVREAAWRVIGQRHFDVQLIGGIVLHRGQIAEMKTGEGKTLVATLPLYLNALAGRSVHLVTVNDYLSRVGAGWMAPVYHFLGLSTGVIVHDAAYIYDPEYSDDSQYDQRLQRFKKISRREAYECDILYGTNNEFGFDYLRDNMVPNLERMSQRELYYAIVDEVDSILIDEARTPLIISAPAEESTDKYYKFAELVSRLEENVDYNVDEKMKAATLSESGVSKMEKALGVENIYTSGGIREVHHIEQALKAHALFKLDRDYIVQEGEVIIVDEFTGRLMHGRRYGDGLHQAIEAKEGVKIQRESETLATITFQNYFRMYKKLSGMTGTAVTEAEEFAKIYSLETMTIPTHRPMVRKNMNDLIYASEEGKYKAVIADVKKRHENGQPILIGTISIEKNELLVGIMEREGLKSQLLNAKNHEKEAKIIADAGKLGAITIATNMAGRGVDIMLGGTEPDFSSESENGEESEEHADWKRSREKVLAAGGLHVVGTERHEARRIDNQLRGRAGRQGDPGSSQFYISMEDDLMRVFGGDRMKSIMSSLKVPEDMPIENKMISKSIESAQTKVEGNNFDIRKHLVEYDDVINKHREAIYKQRRDILEIAEKAPDKQKLSEIIFEKVRQEIEQVVCFHTASDYMKDWNLEEIYEVVSTIFPVEKKLKSDLSEFAKNETHKLDKAAARTKIIEHLEGLAKEIYEKIKISAKQAGVPWHEVEKAVLIRSIDNLWIEHLEAMASLRQGIGLRGYGQRDPLVEYKREGYRLYGELNSLIQKKIVYSIYKVGMMDDHAEKGFSEPSLADRAKEFSAPLKTAGKNTSSFSGYKTGGKNGNGTVDMISKEKLKDESGNKIGRNDPCPCGSGKKYKKCCWK